MNGKSETKTTQSVVKYQT